MKTPSSSRSIIICVHHTQKHINYMKFLAREKAIYMNDITMPMRDADIYIIDGSFYNSIKNWI